MLLDFKVRVEVEDNLLVGLRGVNNPLAVLVGGIILGVSRRGDVASIFGIQTTSTGWVWKREQGPKELQICYSLFPDPHSFFPSLPVAD